MKVILFLAISLLCMHSCTYEDREVGNNQSDYKTLSSLTQLNKELLSNKIETRSMGRRFLEFTAVASADILAFGTGAKIGGWAGSRIGFAAGGFHGVIIGGITGVAIGGAFTSTGASYGAYRALTCNTVTTHDPNDKNNIVGHKTERYDDLQLDEVLSIAAYEMLYIDDEKSSTRNSKETEEEITIDIWQPEIDIPKGTG